MKEFMRFIKNLILILLLGVILNSTMITAESFAQTNPNLLLHFDGDFTDSSTANHPPTVFGATIVSSPNSPLTPNSQVGSFDGDNDYITFPDSDDWDFGTEDFTVDFWAKIFPPNQQSYLSHSGGVEYFRDNSGFLNFGAAKSTVAFAPSQTNWQHVAVTRSGTTIRFFIDGAQLGSAITNSENFSFGSGDLFIGAKTNLANDFQFHMEEFRVIKGTALWTSNFTKPTEPEESAPADTTPPDVDAPIDINEEAEGPTTPVTLGTATANDDTDGALTPTITTSPVSITITNGSGNFPVGVHTITYTATDAANNVGTATQTVTINDTTGPEITLVGDNPLNVVAGTNFDDPGFSANDLVDGGVSVIVGGDTVNTSVVGSSFTITYDAQDNNTPPNQATRVTRTVNIVDGTPPVITLVGANPQTIALGGTYTELGATANDPGGDGVIPPNNISINSAAVDTNTLGSYSVTYDVDDSAGNSAVQKIRTVNVVDAAAPVVTAPGNLIKEASGDNTTVGLENNPGQTPATASANDAIDGTLTPTAAVTSIPTVTLTNNEGSFPIGIHTITWSATDAGSNTGTAIQTITVQDTTGPNIILGEINNQTTPVNIEVGTPYVEPTNTAIDIVNGSRPITISGDTVETSTVGSTFTIFYTAEDESGNETQVTRTVNIVPPPDVTPPIITLLGDDPQTINVGAAYTELGATAEDPGQYGDGDITEDIVIDATDVNTAIAGTYSVSYNVADGAGNPAPTQTRTVNVVIPDTTAPTCTASDITVTATGNLTQVTLDDPVFDPDVTSFSNDAPTEGFAVGSHVVTWTVFDAANNSGTCTLTVTVNASTAESEKRIPITSLPMNIDQPGSYFFTGNLTFTDTTGSAITISNPDVTVSLNGFSLVGNPACADCNGIDLGANSNVDISDGILTQFGGTGIINNSATANGIRIKNVRVTSNGGHGIYLNGTGHSLITSTISDNQTGGVFLQDASTITANNIFNNGGDGIGTITGSNITGNTVHSNTGSGIVADNGAIVNLNTVHSNHQEGISVISGSQVTENTSYLNGSSGIVAGAGSAVADNTVSQNNTAAASDKGGIRVTNDVTVKDNTLAQNTTQNIYVEGNNNIIKNNVVIESDVGIHFVTGTTDNFYSGNTAHNNTTAAFNGDLPTGAGDGGGNVDF